MAEYYLLGAHALKPRVLIHLGGEYVNLKGKDVTQEVKATKLHPARTVKARGLTQADLKDLYENGDDGGGIYKNRVIGKREKTKKLGASPLSSN